MGSVRIRVKIISIFQEKLCRNWIRRRMTQNSNRNHRIGPAGTLEVRNQPFTHQLVKIFEKNKYVSTCESGMAKHVAKRMWQTQRPGIRTAIMQPSESAKAGLAFGGYENPNTPKTCADLRSSSNTRWVVSTVNQ